MILTGIFSVSIFQFLNFPTPQYIYIYVCMYGVGGVWIQLLGVQGARASVILVLRECIWNPAPWVILHVGWSWMYLECARGLVCPSNLWRYRLHGLSSTSFDLSSWFPPWVTASRFLAGNRGAELKLTMSSSIARVGVGGFTSVPRLLSFSSLFGVDTCQLRSGGIRSLPNK